ncbi:hypothetical protein [Oceanicoccus sp. KOV_DT_Chl]|uniref:hypothetical protein n=1 Tax=Oceanicoccus sp. KOV_DT_Chl TaxID=1904639 RepID=UPI00135A9A4E|nr:hypothetical protein [Oceanicoccus sp. KOV_DT_Chl]
MINSRNVLVLDQGGSASRGVVFTSSGAVLSSARVAVSSQRPRRDMWSRIRSRY